MIKIKSKNIANIVIFLGIMLTLSIMGYKILSNGIYSPSISLGKIHIQGFYLRLNNKFILNIDELDLSKFQSTQKTEKDLQEDSIKPDEILGWIKKFLFVISYFENLNINNIVLNDHLKRSVQYDGIEYKINLPDLIAKFAIEEGNKVTQLQITQLEILSLGIQVQGNLSYQGLKKTLEADVAITPKEIPDEHETPTFYIRAITDFYKIDLEASTSRLYNLESIKPFILKLKNQTLNDWLFKNVQYEVLKLHALRFQTTLDKHFLTKLEKTLELDLAIESPKIYLDSHIQPIEARRIVTYMHNGSLHFVPKEPSFEQIKLDGSEVILSNIFTQPLGVRVSINSQNAILNDKLSELLALYHVNLPLRSPHSKAQVKLDIDIQTKNEHTDVRLNGNIRSAEMTLSMGNQSLLLQHLDLRFVHTDTKAHIEIANTKLDYAQSIQGTLNALWNLQDASLHGDLLIDKFALNASAFSQNAKVPSIPEGSDELTKRIIEAIYEDSQKGMSEDIIHIDTNTLKKIAIVGDLGESKTIALPDFGLYMYIGEESVFELKDIAKLYAYSPLLQYFDIPSGYAKIHTKDFETFTLDGEVDNLNYPLYDKNSQKLSHYKLLGTMNAKGIYIGSNDKKFLFVKEGNVIKVIINDYNLRIDEVFSSPIPLLAQINKDNETKETLNAAQRQELEAFLRAKQSYERRNNISPHITYIEAANMDFYLNEYVIPSDFASMSIRDGIIRADVTYGNGVANVDMAYSRANLRLSNFSDKFLNRVWQRDIFNGGLFNFKGFYDSGALQGEISVQNTIYKDLAIVQNILALIDTIPALLTFRKPGLGANGYEVKSGKIDFVINDEFLVLENIHLIGSSIDVEGGGLVNLKDKGLDVILRASTLKTLTDVISKIPLINYVILGDDGKFTTGIVMKGTLDEPKSEISVAEDILLSPFEMVGRILKPVDKLLSGLSEALESSVENLPTTPAQTHTQNENQANDTPKAEQEQQIEQIEQREQEKQEGQKDKKEEQGGESREELEEEEDSINEPNLPQEEDYIEQESIEEYSTEEEEQEDKAQE